jgi:DNA (cytosine-5)-methyltransferase 1
MKAIDLFAGWGGFTLGASQAGIEVVYAANHWPLAVEAHAANHPGAQHVCQDLRQADWASLPDFDLLLASPACQGHSTAAQPGRAASGTTRRSHDALRATAWAVLDCAEVTMPRAIVVENVPDFANWGAPHDPKSGALFRHWLQGFEILGYRMQVKRLRASHFGVPQRRDRLFVIGTRTDVELDFDVETDEPGFGPSIEWDQGNWRRIDAMPKRYRGAQQRLRTASERFGRSTVMQVSHHRGLPLSEPLRTVTTKDQWAVVDGELYRPLTVRETARAMGFPDDYGWPEHASRKDAIKGLGNAVCPPVARAVVERVAEVVA